MGFLKSGAAALGKLLTVGVLAAAFLFGLVGTVYLSLRGEEVKVPEVVGKDYMSSEKEIADLGLKIKKRATRYSQEKPNTILEQSPRAGETVKTGMPIFVVVSEANPDSNEAPATIKKGKASPEEEEGTDLAPPDEKPAKANKNSNVKKPSQTSRDVIKTNKNASANSATGNANAKSNSNDNKSAPAASGNKNSSSSPANGNKSEPPKSGTPKPAPAKTPAGAGGGDLRTRRVP